jgi:hypothetical protein
MKVLAECIRRESSLEQSLRPSEIRWVIFIILVQLTFKFIVSYWILLLSLLLGIIIAFIMCK